MTTKATASRASEAELLREALKEIRASIFDPVNEFSIACTVWMAKGNGTMVDFIDHALSAVPPQGQGQEGVSVKALEWEHHPQAGGQVRAPSEFGTYRISFFGDYALWGRLGSGGGLSHRAVTIDAAKAAAQADFERRVLSCLTDTPKPGVSADDLAVLAGEISRHQRQHETNSLCSVPDARIIPALQRMHDALSGLSTPPAAAPAEKEAGR